MPHDWKSYNHSAQPYLKSPKQGQVTHFDLSPIFGMGADSTGTEEITHLQNKLHFNKTIHNINCGFLFFSVIFPFAAKEFNYKESVPAETIECLRRNP